MMIRYYETFQWQHDLINTSLDSIAGVQRHINIVVTKLSVHSTKKVDFTLKPAIQRIHHNRFTNERKVGQMKAACFKKKN